MTSESIVVVSKKSLLQQIASRHAKKILVADEPKEALELIKSDGCNLVLFDDTFSPDDIGHFITTTDNHNHNINVLTIAADEKQPNLKNDFRKAGAIDYLCAASELKQIEQAIQENLKAPQAQPAHQQPDKFFVDNFAESTNLAGVSEAMQKTIKMTRLIASSQCNPVLVSGETGTGKELVARALHKLKCPDEPFVAVNCAALTANLLESELFGHVKGSFTGADKDKTGLLELAENGMVFLDEISEMPLNLQAKLLRVLQEKSFRKVGGTKIITCKAVVVASSNRNLLDEVKNKRFRQDLYYRLNICPIKLMPLRDERRKQDIRLLADYFLANSTIWPKKAEKIKSLTPLALETLENHSWPGNVRELKNVIDRAIILETTDRIGLSSIEIEQPGDNSSADKTDKNEIRDLSLATAERELIARALKEAGGQKTRAASLLGITRATLYAKVKQYNINDIPSKTPNQNTTSHKKPQPVGAV